jgi:hypothetical protein
MAELDSRQGKCQGGVQRVSFFAARRHSGGTERSSALRGDRSQQSMEEAFKVKRPDPGNVNDGKIHGRKGECTVAHSVFGSDVSVL